MGDAWIEPAKGPITEYAELIEAPIPVPPLGTDTAGAAGVGFVASRP